MESRLKPVELSSPKGPPTEYMRVALDEAERRPLNEDLRIIIASPQWHIVIDASHLPMLAHSVTHEIRGLENGRPYAAHVICSILENGLHLQRDDLEVLRFAAMAFFDVRFTSGVDPDKTEKTAWNTLTLEVETSFEKVSVARRAIRIEYPDGKRNLAPSIGGLFAFSQEQAHGPDHLHPLSERVLPSGCSVAANLEPARMKSPTDGTPPQLLDVMAARFPQYAPPAFVPSPDRASYAQGTLRTRMTHGPID